MTLPCRCRLPATQFASPTNKASPPGYRARTGLLSGPDCSSGAGHRPWTDCLSWLLSRLRSGPDSRSPTDGFCGLPPIGTPREQVVRQFGSPTVSIVTSTGETLHFSGGVAIFIQNGQVASPR